MADISVEDQGGNFNTFVRVSRRQKIALTLCVCAINKSWHDACFLGLYEIKRSHQDPFDRMLRGMRQKESRAQ